MTTDLKERPIINAIITGDLDKIRQYLMRELFIDHRDDLGRTEAHYAAEWGSNEIITAFIDAGADFDIKDNLGITAREILIRKQKDRMRRLSLKALLL